MFGKTTLRGILAIAFLFLGLGLGACTQANPSYMTGEESHERHATGMESQVGDL
ncbi:MAG: hypothetical protein GXY44_07605 [Phycisphaerales bacterium]|nr:hypothetical protein [Phycisphaerales bacterium]